MKSSPYVVHGRPMWIDPVADESMIQVSRREGSFRDTPKGGVVKTLSWSAKIQNNVRKPFNWIAFSIVIVALLTATGLWIAHSRLPEAIERSQMFLQR